MALPLALFATLSDLMLLVTGLLSGVLQPESTGGAAASGMAAGAGAAAAPASPLDGCGGGSMMLPLVVMLGFMYFFVMRPEQKRAKEREVTLKALLRGDIVRTNSGIRGEIVRFENNDRDVILEIAPKTRINVFRTQILGKETAATDSASTPAGSKDSKESKDNADKKKD